MFIGIAATPSRASRPCQEWLLLTHFRSSSRHLRLIMLLQSIVGCSVAPGHGQDNETKYAPNQRNPSNDHASLRDSRSALP